MITEYNCKKPAYIIALDLATQSGISVWRYWKGKYELLNSGTYSLSGKKPDQEKDKRMELSRRCVVLHDLLEDCLTWATDLDQLVVVKELGTGGPNVGGWTKTVQSAYDQAVYAWAYSRGDITFMLEASPAALKKWATGDGQLKKNKPAMIREAESISNKEMEDDNEADAVILGHMICQFTQWMDDHDLDLMDKDDDKLIAEFKRFRNRYTRFKPYDSI